MRVCTPTTPLNSGVTGSKFTKFTHDVARLSQINFLKSEKNDIAIRLGMPWLRINVNSPIWPISTLKLVTMAMSLEPSK